MKSRWRLSEGTQVFKDNDATQLCEAGDSVAVIRSPDICFVQPDPTKRPTFDGRDEIVFEKGVDYVETGGNK